mgnify:FL=1|jgi:hypothetical protein
MSIPIKINKTTNLPETSPTIGKGFPIDNSLLDANRKNVIPFNATDINPFDSMNFTFKYTDPLSKYTSYRVPVNRYMDWNEKRAQNQSNVEKWGRGVTKGLATGLGAVVENTLGVIAGLGELATGGAYYDNYVGKSVDKMNDYLKEAIPNYYTQEEQNMTTLQKLGTANFWSDQVMNGLGYSVGSLATWYMTGGAGLIPRIAGLTARAKALNGLYKGSKAISTGTNLTAQALKSSATLRSANMLELGLYMSLAESSVEARESQRTMYQDLINRTIEESNGLYQSELQIPEEERADMLQASYSAGNANFITQLPVLMGTNLFMFGKHVMGFGASKANRLYKPKDVAYDAAAKKVINQVGNRGTMRAIASRLSPLGKGAGTEAFQEGWQFASKVGSVDYHTDKYFNGGSEDMIRSMYEGIKDTFGTQEGLESMLIGAIVGGGMGGGRSAIQKPYAARVKNAQHITDLLNGGYLANSANKAMNYDAMVKVHTDMEKALEEGNIKAFKDAQNRLLHYHAYDAIQSGGFDVFIEKLNDAATLEDSEFAEQFGFNPDISIQEQTKTYRNPNGQTKQDLVKKISKRLNKFKEAYDAVHEQLPLENPAVTNQAYVWGTSRMLLSEEKRKALETLNQEKQNLRAQLIFSLAGIDSRNERMSNIREDVQALLNDQVNMVNGVPMGIGNPLSSSAPIETTDPLYEVNRVRDALNDTINELRKNNANPLVIQEFIKFGNDYLQLLNENQSGVTALGRLNSDPYFQARFQEEVKANQKAAKDRVKAEKETADIADAKTEEEVKNAAPDAQGKTKVTKDIKEKELRKKEQESKSYYLQQHPNKSVKERLNLLTGISQAELEKLSPTEKAGLAKAIEELQKRLKDSKSKDMTADQMESQDEQVTQDIQDIKETKTKFEEKEEYAQSLGFEDYSHVLHSLNKRQGLRKNTDINKERFMQLTKLEIKNLAAESASAQANLKAAEVVAPVATPEEIVEVEAEKQGHEKIIEDTPPVIQTNLFIDSTPSGEKVPTLGLKLASNYDGTTIEVTADDNSTTRRKIPVDNNGVPIERNNQDTLNGRPIPINTDLLLGDVSGTEVEFVIVENDWFVENHKGKPTEIQEVPIYVKIGNEYVGKLQSSPSTERAELVQKIRKTEGKVEIERIQNELLQTMTNSYNNETESKGSRFYGREKITYEEMQKLYADVLDRIRQRANANKILRSKGRKTITAQEVIDDIVQNYINPTPLQAMPVGNPGLFLLKEYIKEQIEGTAELGEKVTTKIAEVFASSSNINNAVLEDAPGIRRFYNPLDVIGNPNAEGVDQNRNVVLAFMNPDNDVPQFDVMYFEEGLVQEKNITESQIQQVQRIQSDKFDQIALVVPGANVPGGNTRILITSTANLSNAAQREVIRALKDRDFSKMKDITAVSIRKEPARRERFLYHDQFENGENYIVYYSNKLDSLVRINELEMIKGFNNAPATFQQVILDESSDSFSTVRQTTTEKVGLNLEEDLINLLERKKYNVDMGRANSSEVYTSPVTGVEYATYQHYLFDGTNELDARVQGEGHHSIISIDVVKKGQSMYNNPMVSFEKGAVVKTTAQEVANSSSFNAKSENDNNNDIVVSQNLQDKFPKKC